MAAKKDLTLEKYKKIYRELVIEEEQKSFSTHLVIYLFVNLLFIFANIMYTPHVIWFVFLVAGWGIGLLAHHIYITHWIEKRLKEKERIAHERMANKKAKRY